MCRRHASRARQRGIAMSEPIRVGDLVMIVHTHCNHKSLGAIFRVGYIGRAYGICAVCKEFLGMRSFAGVNQYEYSTPLSWLKRIDPLSDPQSVKTTDKVTA